MASTYTPNTGLEKPGIGDQDGAWGTTLNTNFDIIDRASNGSVTVTLASAGTSGSPNTLVITNGTLSDGQYRFIEFDDGGDLGATAYVQLTPSDAKKIVHVRNSLSGSRSILIFQGTYSASNDFEVPAGKDVLIKFDGGGTGAVVSDVFVDLKVTALEAGGIDNTPIGANSAAAGTFTTLTADSISTTSGSLSITSTDAGAAAGPIFTLYRNSASPADADVIGAVDFDGEDDGGNQTTYARTNAVAADVTGGSEDGHYVTSIARGGTLVERVRVKEQDVVVLDDSTSGDTRYDLHRDETILANGELVSFRAYTTGVSQKAEVGVTRGTANTADEVTGYLNLPASDGVDMNDQFLWVGLDGDFRISSTRSHVSTNSGTVVGDQTSDENLKTILGAVPYGLAEINRLSPIRYRYKASENSDRIENNEHLGFGAQTTRGIVPEIVYDSGDQGLRMRYVELIPVLVRAIQELSARVEALESP